MKIVDFKHFVKYPAGTIFSYYEPAVFFGLWRKEKTIYAEEDGVYPDDCDDRATDYFQQSLLPSHEADDKITLGGIERWGEFSWDQQYAIYEEADLEVLRDLLGVTPKATTPVE